MIFLIYLDLFPDFLVDLSMKVPIPDVYSSLLGQVGRSLEIPCSLVPTESTFLSKLLTSLAPSNNKNGC